MREIIYELTNWCPHKCAFCSSNTVSYRTEATYLDINKIKEDLKERTNDGHDLLDKINLSGGEPLAHPDFYAILILSQKSAKSVVVYTNALIHICFNAHIIDGIRVEANVTLTDNVSKVHVLKRVAQGREASRPEVVFSRNWEEDCFCNHRVMKPNGELTRSPCDKHSV